MLFWLKKTVSFWLMPLPLCLSALVVGLLLLRTTRWRRLGRGLVIAAVGLLLIASNKFVAKSLLRPLETIYPAMPEFVTGAPLPPDLAACRFVVVLGGGHGRTPDVAATNVLSTAALSRIVEGIRILRALPEARLIVTGGAEPGPTTHAKMLAQAAQAFDIAPERILYITLKKQPLLGSVEEYIRVLWPHGVWRSPCAPGAGRDCRGGRDRRACGI